MKIEIMTAATIMAAKSSRFNVVEGVFDGDAVGSFVGVS